MKRILVIRGGAIGDFVLTLPAIALLRNAWPHSHLEILGNKHIISLAENRFYANATRSIESGKLARFFARAGELPSGMVDYFAGFDLIVSYLFDPDSIFENNLRRCGKFALISGPSRPNESSHASRQLAAPLADIGLKLNDSAAKLFPSEDDCRDARQFLESASEPLIALHPGSGSETKNWPLPYWIELVTSLLREVPNASLVIFGGEADRDALRELRHRFNLPRIFFAEDLPLPQVAAIAERCALFIGHDSGISHIAAAVGTPCLLLFGLTKPEVWAPANPAVRIVRAEGPAVAGITVNEMFEHVREALPARLAIAV